MSAPRRFFITALISIMSAPYAFAQDACRDILQYAAKNDTIDTYAFSSASNVYSEHCEGSSAKSNRNVSVGVQAVIESIPLGINVGTGSAAEKMNQFCKIFSERRQEFDTRFKSSSVVNQASVSAWERCVALRAEGVEFRPQLSSAFVMVEIRRTTGQSLSINGVLHDPKLLDCKAPSENGALAPVTGSTVFKIQDDARWTLACERKPQVNGDLTEFPGVEVGIVTNRGSLSVPVPKEAKMPSQWAKEFETQLGSLRRQLSAQKISCETATAATTGHYPAVTAVIPDSKRPTHQLVGGGCRMNGYPQIPHNGTMLESRPSDDNTGWYCRAGDPPNIPLNITITATARFCHVDAR